MNPLLARDLVDAVRKLPDAERTEKRAFRRWAAELGPKFPYARAGGTKRIEDLLRTRDFVDMAEREIGSSPVLAEQFRSLIIGRLRKSLAERRTAPGLKAWLRKMLPKGVKARFRASKGERGLLWSQRFWLFVQ